MSEDPRDLDTRGIEANAIEAGNTSRLRWLVVILSLITVAALAYAITDFVAQRDVAQQGERSAKETTQDVAAPGTNLADEVLAACKGDDRDARSLKALGLCGSASTAKADIAKATPGSPGTNGATGAQGPAGASVTFGDILSGIRTYCVPRRDCSGNDGSNGRNGEDSTIPGPKGADSTVAGPPGKDSTVPGPKGDKGEPGKDSTVPGPAGKGIVSMSCSGGLSPVTYTVTYSDGTSSTFTCGALPPVEP